MDTDEYYNFWSNLKTLLTLQSISLPIFLIFIEPVYQFSKTRIPMGLLFSKSIGMAIVLFILLVDTFFALIKIYPKWWIYVLYLYNVPFFGVRIHLLAMAINRCFSVYFPFKYQKFNKRAFIRKICFVLWMIALIISPPSIYVGLNRINIFPLTLFLRTNLEQICIYSALLFYLLMAIKLIWMKFHLLAALESNVLEKDYYKISAVCIVSILPFLFGILSLKMMQTFIAANIYQKNHLLQNILQTFSIPFLQVANFSEEICLLILSVDFRAIFKKNLIRNLAQFLKAITFGRFKMELINSANYENDQLNNNATNNGTNTISNNVAVSSVCMTGLFPVIKMTWGLFQFTSNH